MKIELIKETCPIEGIWYLIRVDGFYRKAVRDYEEARAIYKSIKTEKKTEVLEQCKI